MSCANTSPAGARDALVSAFCASLTATASISGDIPSLLQHAYYRHFGDQMPPANDTDRIAATTSAASLEYLLATLSETPPLEPTAQALLDRARSILTSGPPLSMNVELADGEELSVALHTLNQGAVWACLVGGGANPDLDDRVLEETREEEPNETETHDKIRNALTPEAKCLWFLCRKFFFTLNVAEKDGESYQSNVYDVCYHHRMYMGRLFMLDTANHTALTRARMPRTLEVYSNMITHIARTPKGLWGWGATRYGQLGFGSYEFVDPTRLTFPACPKVAELEASLHPWEKHRMVTGVSMKGNRTFILTPVGTVVTGSFSKWFTGHVDEHCFHPVALPAGFVPDHIMHICAMYYVAAVVLSMGDRQMISGSNDCGRLGLGHKNVMSGFVDLPFRVDLIIPSSFFTVFLSDHQLLFAGEVPHHIAQSGLLPGFSKDNKCLTPTPLRFPERVTGFLANEDLIVWVTADVTHYCQYGTPNKIPFKATACSPAPNRFRDPAGQWFEMVRESAGVAKLGECEAPRKWEVFIPVDVDLTPQS
ncbi:hypothetical protein J8273_7296 [Carpediemonas membranifera]|uniref:Uncharacterized protein n=1 Tax=Carpediemonas membranifera TaxID=201153 RepID=A0A8J6B1H7_9EUKA|nr:hypothetical protein J8273_7296 [Carpediemonas membranifera]|eukprot:KAG9391022.1 hypothetical protein J8273_7296 [Carpediemonas membranifera]